MRIRPVLVALSAGVLLTACGAGCVVSDVSVGPQCRTYMSKNVALVDVSPLPEDRQFNGLVMRKDTTNGPEATAALERALMNLFIYKFKDRGRLDEILNELDLQRTDLVDSRTAVRVGKLAGLDGIAILRTQGEFKLVLGVFMYVKKTLTVRLIDVETSDVVWSGHATLTDAGIFPLPPSSTLFTSAEKRMARSFRDELRRKALW